MSAVLDFFSNIYQDVNDLKQTQEYQSLNATAHTIVFCTLILTAVLELWSLPTVRLLLEKQVNGRELYVKGLFWNVFNQYCLAIPLYSLLGSSLTRQDELEWNSVKAVASNLFEIIWVWGVHAIGYYHVHKAFHLSPRYYKYHKFHHRFNTYVPPSSANAVEAVEYISAYLSPFVLALIFWPLSAHNGKIHADNLSIATSIIGALSLLVHTPKLEEIYMANTYSETSWTRWFVGTEDHLNHHRKLKCHYASPTFNVDNIVDAMSEAWKGTEK